MKRLLPHIFLALASSALAEQVSYNRDVRPILSENCFFCHGFDANTREAGLRLDTFAGATEEINGRHAVVPGDPLASELIRRITSTDKDIVMPPHDSVYKLKQEEIQTLTQWIKQGAEYQEHWAYRPVTRPNIPKGAKHPVDAFLQRTYLQSSVKAVPNADPRTLLRRLSYDLRGLAPTAEEVADFTTNPTEEAFLAKVDEYLGSIEYAEHQGLLWLDLVRYADSSGMVSDEPIASGPYRKYVIEAFHNNMPFDQFTREQIAGDLLPNRNDRTLIASGYNRLVKTNCEAGVNEGEALYALKGEHVRALGTVWLGQTTGCAECHDHKYDPISAKDYYSLAAFFDTMIETGVYEPGDRRVPLHYLYDDADQSRREHELAGKIDQLRKEIYEQEIQPAAYDQWLKELKAAASNSKKLEGIADWIWFPKQLGVAHILEGDFVQTPAGRVTQAAKDETVRHLSAEALRVGHQKGAKSFFTEVQINPDDQPEFIALQVLHGAYRRVGWHSQYNRTYYWGNEIEDTSALSKWIDSRKLKHMGPLPESALTGEITRLEVPEDAFQKAAYIPQGMGWVHKGGTVTWGNSGYTDTAQRIWNNEQALSSIRYYWDMPLHRDDFDDLQHLLLRSIWIKPEKRREVHTTVIEMAFREAQKPELVTRLTELYRQAHVLRQNSTPALVSKNGGKPKVTRVVARGNFMDTTGPIVKPALPEHFVKAQPDQQLTRIDLANWLISHDNPMTPRVFMNRLWYQFYGRGISNTLEDAGNQGDWPSHPDLLDYLADEFRNGWDIKKMIRMLVTADAYKLSSIPSKPLAANDPTNRLHAYQSRFRHSAEEIRDAALRAAGLLRLTSEVPHESFFPYQPGAYWEKSNKIMYGSRYQIWDTAEGDSQYQRSLYTYWKRQNIHPALLALDAPTRQECTAKRPITNTPAQALALLNDPQFVEAARGLAEQVITQPSAERIEFLFQCVLQRPPAAQEKAEIEKMIPAFSKRFAEHPDEAKDLLKIGHLPVAKGINSADLATWTAISRIMLNLHEFITRS